MVQTSLCMYHRKACLERCIKPFVTGNTSVCHSIFEAVGRITVHVVASKYVFHSNSETDASELLENPEEMLPRYLY